MKQAMLYGAGDLRFEDFSLEPDQLGECEVFVKTDVTALSTGTDLGNYLGDSTYVPDAPGYPRAVGYSNVGTVQAVGSAVENLRVGQRVFSTRPHQSAYIAPADDVLVPVPDGVSCEQATLSYLTHLGIAALRQAQYQAGEHVAVVGLGVIGLSTVALARAMGAKVVGIANSPLRNEAAIKVGAHATYLASEISKAEDLYEVFGETGTDLVILTANPWPAYRLSVEIARIGGRVSILGFPGRGQPVPDFNPLDPTCFYAKQLVLLGAGNAPRVDCPASEIRFNIRRNLAYILELMASGAMNLESLISHRLPAPRMKEAYEMAKEHSKSLIAAVFDWRNVDT